MALAAPGQVQWGDAATWMAAVLTGGSLIAAVVLLALQRRDLKDREEDHRSEQARLVATWLGQPISDDPMKLMYLTRNASSEPVYDVSVQVAVGVRGTYHRHVDFTLPPGESRCTWIPLPAPPRTSAPGVAVMFRDAAGRRWLRSSTGVLKTPTQDEQTQHIAQDPGAWNSVGEHPTLNVILDEQGNPYA
jgi:hypothetical protein